MGWGSGNLGGGSGGINFKIVGGTSEPASPKENEIWVNTDTEITSYIFSATEPATPEAGMVWITTGTASGVEFNALKKNSIMVYPLYAKQYIDGTWINVSAMSYQNGSWVEWITKTYIYKDGLIKYELVMKNQVANNGESLYIVGSDYLTNHVISKYMFPIDTYDTLNVKITANSGTAVVLGVALTNTNISLFDHLTAHTSTFGTGVLSLDISSLTGNFYVLLSAYGSGAYNATEWWLEGQGGA